MENTTTKALFDLLVTRDLEPEILDHDGKPVTSPEDAEMFSFDWKTENKNYGTVVILMGANNNMQVFFGDNLGRTMEGDDKADWYNFLQQLKSFATRNLLKFEISNLNRLKYTMQGMSAIKEGLFEGYYGKKNISYSDQPAQVRLVIKHNKDIAEGEARYRAVECLFLETADGERFKLPFKNLTGGRAMARHVAEGGRPYDAFGQHISDLVSEMNTMARFIRAAKGKEFDESTKELVEAAIRHYGDIKAKAKKMIGQRGYYEEVEKFNPAEFTDSEITTEAIRDMFIETSIDHRIEEALPILTRLANQPKEDKMKEIEEFEDWSNKVMEGTWALPDSDQAKDQLKQLFSKPLIVGPDGTNATEQLYDLLGDDHLFDIISEIAQSDPNANLWDDLTAMERVEELVPWATADMFGVDNSQEPDTSDDEVEEGIGDVAKKVGGAIKTGAKAVGKAIVGPDDEELLDKLRKDAGLPPRMAIPNKNKQQGVGEDLDTDGVMMTKQSNMSS